MPRILTPILAVVCGAIASAPIVAADSATPGPGAPGPYVDSVRWVSYDGLSTLRVYPTAAGREAAGELAKTAAQTGQAWAEVIALAPDADTSSIRSQFLCHWRFAEFAEPGKPSWDLESWRPAVDDSTMILTGCNPGEPEKG